MRIYGHIAVFLSLTLHTIFQSVLQQHVIFWDRDNDGVIWPTDTFIGFRDLGFNLLFCLIAALVINGSFSYPTW